MATAACMSSCNDFDSLNKNPDLMERVNPGAMLNPVLYNLGIYNWQRYNGFTGELMQYSSSSSSGGYSRYYFTESAGDAVWSNYYKWLANIKEIGVQAEAYNDDNYRAIALTLQAWVAQGLTDTFGDVPFSEACQAEAGITRPVFDKQRDIYATIIADLKKANGLYDESAELAYNKSGELLYGSDVKKWHKFTNSLLLRVLLRVGETEELKAVLNDPATYPVFESNADGALLAIGENGAFPPSKTVQSIHF